MRPNDAQSKPDLIALARRATLLFLILGSAACDRATTGICDRTITHGKGRSEVILEGRTYTYDACMDSIPFEHYAWVRQGQTGKLSIRLYQPGEGEQPVGDVKFGFLEGVTRDADNTLHFTSDAAKILVQLNNVYWSNYLYISVLDSIRTYSVASVTGDYDIRPEPDREGAGTIHGVLRLTDPGTVLRYEQCLDVFAWAEQYAKYAPPIGVHEVESCDPSIPFRDVAASFTGTVCGLTGSCAAVALSGTATLDTTRAVSLCISADASSTLGCTSSQSRLMTTGSSRLTIRNDSIMGSLIGVCVSRDCVGGRITGIRKK